jgi:hypothetical protein
MALYRQQIKIEADCSTAEERARRIRGQARTGRPADIAAVWDAEEEILALRRRQAELNEQIRATTAALNSLAEDDAFHESKVEAGCEAAP